MKLKYSKLLPLFALALICIGYPSCVKENKSTYTDFSQVQDLVILQNAGLSNFAGGNVVITPTSADTLHFNVYAQLASVSARSTDIAVTIGIDDAKRPAYNTANSTAYLAFNANMFKLGGTKITIPAGQHYAKTTFDVYTKNVDLSKSWMIPISITDASGKNLSSNQNTIYFHIIGNPLSGTYKVSGSRYNYIGPAVGTPASVTNLATTKIALPVSATTIALDYANVGGGWGYEVTFNATYTQIINVVPNETLLAGIQAGTFALTAPAQFDAVTKTITLHTTYTNTALNARVIDEIFVKQ